MTWVLSLHWEKELVDFIRKFVFCVVVLCGLHKLPGKNKFKVSIVDYLLFISEELKNISGGQKVSASVPVFVYKSVTNC